MSFRIRKDIEGTQGIVTSWMLPESGWYRGRITFTNLVNQAATLTQEQCDAYLALPNMHAGAFAEEITE